MDYPAIIADLKRALKALTMSNAAVVRGDPVEALAYANLAGGYNDRAGEKLYAGGDQQSR